MPFFPVLRFKERNQPVAICQSASLQCNQEHRKPCVVPDLCSVNIHYQIAKKHRNPCRWDWDGSSTVSPLFHLYTTWELRWRLCSQVQRLQPACWPLLVIHWATAQTINKDYRNSYGGFFSFQGCLHPLLSTGLLWMSSTGCRREWVAAESLSAACLHV